MRKLLILLFAAMVFPVVLAQADSFTSFTDETECQAGDEFIMYRSGTGTRNVTCAGINTYVDTIARFETLTAATGNNFVSGDVGYVNSSGQIALANALNDSTASGLLLIATEAVNAGNSGTFQYLTGKFTTSGLTPGAIYFLDTTNGGISTTKPTADGNVQREIGVALSATELVLGASRATLVSASGSGGTTTPPATTPTVESSSSSFESDGTITTTAPADIVAGDLLVLFAATDQTDATETTYTPPSGFADLVAQQRANSGGAGTDFGAWYKIAGTSEPASYDLGESGLKNTATVMLRISGIDPDNALDAVSCSVGTAEPFTGPSIDVTVDDALVLAVHAWDSSKTVVLAPAGFTQAAHSDNSGVDLWVGHRNQATSGASGTNVMDVSSGAPWIACTLSFKEPNATSSGGGTGATEGAGPFSLLDDGTPLGVPIKLTLPIACDGTFVGSACEIFPSTDSHWQPGDPALETYEHPTYFIRDPNYYTFCSPNAGATTSTANNGRSELRYLQNHSSGVMSRQFVFKAPSTAQMANNVKANIGQIHRNPGSPVFKGTYTHKHDGSGIYRVLSKKTDGGSDFSFDIGLGDKVILDSIAPGDYVRVKYEYDIDAETLDFWISNDGVTKTETILTGTPTASLTGVLLDNPSAYSKLGLYMNDAGDGSDTTPYCVEIYQDVYTGP